MPANPCAHARATVGGKEPSGLDDRQRMFIDGISVTLQMLDVAFERLKEGLAELSSARQDEMFYAQCSSTRGRWSTAPTAWPCCCGT
jgi:hypothetical protein